MKKVGIKLFVCVLVLFVSLFVINVIAETKPEIKEYIKDNSFSAVLYSDNKLYLWGRLDYVDDGAKNIILEDVRDIVDLNSYGIVFVDLNNNLKAAYFDELYNYETDKSENQIVVTDVLRDNVKEIDSYHVLTTDNKLYSYDYYHYNDVPYNEKLIMNDVVEWSYNSSNDSYLLLNSEDKLYAYGTNIFGKKINDGEDITLSPLLIAENVREFSCDVYGYSHNSSVYGNFYITNDNELYVMSNRLPYPKLLKENVNKFLRNSFYVSAGKTYQLQYNIENDVIEVSKDEMILDKEVVNVFSSYENWYFTKDNELYYKNDKKYSDIEKVSLIDGKLYVLDKNSKLFTVVVKEEYNNITHEYELVFIENVMLKGVKEVLNSSDFIMNDETLLVRGYGTYDISDFNGTNSSKYNNYVKVKGLPNVNDEIVLSQINLNYNGKTKFVIGETYDFYAEVYPYNAVDKELVWESSDESIAKVNENGTLSFISDGVATITVRSKKYNISDEVEITVFPRSNSIEILSDDVVNLSKNKDKLLKVKISPNNVLPQKIQWTSNAGVNEYNEDIVVFNTLHNSYCYEYDDEDICPKSYDEVVIRVRKTGTYIITATTEDGLYSDSITVNVNQDVTSLSLNPDRNNLFGATLYMYMSESVHMDLNVKVYPEDATNREVEFISSDESIAIVDSNGRVTAKKSGKVTITYKAKNYDVKNTINVLIFDKAVTTKIGDVDGDGLVDILDLVKLRKHVAGVEALE